MRSKLTKFAIGASIMLAMVFTFSCSSGDDGGGNAQLSSSSANSGDKSSSSVNGSSSSGSSSSSVVQSSSSSVVVSSSSAVQSSSSVEESSSSVEYTGGSCDIEDYRTVVIGSQTWMAENWGCYVAGSKCYYNDPANCDKYGRLYDWSTAMSVCPNGWHLPSIDDWDELLLYVDYENGGNGNNGYPYDSKTAGRYLKATAGWINGGNGNDKYGFSALPSGRYHIGGFSGVGNGGFWWSASEIDSYSAYDRGMIYDSDRVGWYRDFKDNILFSVRCVKD